MIPPSRTGTIGAGRDAEPPFTLAEYSRRRHEICRITLPAQDLPSTRSRPRSISRQPRIGSM